MKHLVQPEVVRGGPEAPFIQQSVALKGRQNMKTHTQWFAEWWFRYQEEILNTLPFILNEVRNYDIKTTKELPHPPNHTEEILSRTLSHFRPTPIYGVTKSDMGILALFFGGMIPIAWWSGIMHSTNTGAYFLLGCVILSVAGIITCVVSTITDRFVTRVRDTVKVWSILEDVLDTLARNLFPGEFHCDHRVFESFDEKELRAQAESVLLARAAGVKFLQRQGDPVAETERDFFRKLHGRFFQLGLIKRRLWDDYFESGPLLVKEKV